MKAFAGILLAWLAGVEALSPAETTRRCLLKEALAAVVVAPQLVKAETMGVQLKNGLRYYDVVEGTGTSPRWGQLVKIAYTQSIRQSPAADLKKIDQTDGYLIHHGNGRYVKGLDEGLHTMKVGGKRRIEVPQQLGYTVPGLGPVPEWGFKVRELSKNLDKMESGGTIVFDVELLKVKTDGADRGYYEDNSFTGEELAFIMERTKELSDELNITE